MTALTRSLMLLALIFGLNALPQPAQAAGTLYVSLSSDKKVVKFPIRPNLRNPGPSNFATAFQSPYGIAAYNRYLYFYDTEIINGLGTDIIRRVPLSAGTGTPVTATRYAMTGGRNAMQMAFNTAGVLFFVGHSGNQISKIVSPGSTASTVATMAASGCGAVTAGNVLYTSAKNASAIYRYSPARGVWTNTVLVQNSPSNAALRQPCALAIDQQGLLYIGDTRPSAAGNYQAIIWRLDPTAPVPSATKTLFSVVATGGISDVLGLTFDDAGNLYATVGATETIYQISSSGRSRPLYSFAGMCRNTCDPWGLAFVRDPNDR